MADAVIDLDRYVLGQQGTRAIQAAAVPDAVPS